MHVIKLISQKLNADGEPEASAEAWCGADLSGQGAFAYAPTNTSCHECNRRYVAYMFELLSEWQEEHKRKKPVLPVVSEAPKPKRDDTSPVEKGPDRKEDAEW